MASPGSGCPTPRNSCPYALRVTNLGAETSALRRLGNNPLVYRPLQQIYVPFVDVTGENWRYSVACGGGPDRSALRKGGTWRLASSCSVSGLVLTHAPDLY